MRRARIDANHNEIVQALRDAGCSVQSLASIGKGCPDLLVGRRGMNYLFEIKDGTKPPSQQRLTTDEKKWLAAWAGRAHVVQSAAEALGILGIYESRKEGK